MTNVSNKNGDNTCRDLLIEEIPQILIHYDSGNRTNKENGT
jgi:hypothetical protein